MIWQISLIHKQSSNELNCFDMDIAGRMQDLFEEKENRLA